MHGPSPHGEWLAERAAALQVASTAPKKIVLGRHLIAMGHKPAGWFSQVLDEAFEAQLDGVFGDEAGGLAWLTERMAMGIFLFSYHVETYRWYPGTPRPSA